MLILNAGGVIMSKFINLTSEELEQQINLNAIHVVYLTKSLLPQI
jgi:short-subunit dehydrogenase